MPEKKEGETKTSSASKNEEQKSHREGGEALAPVAQSKGVQGISLWRHSDSRAQESPSPESFQSRLEDLLCHLPREISKGPFQPRIFCGSNPSAKSSAQIPHIHSQLLSNAQAELGTSRNGKIWVTQMKKSGVSTGTTSTLHRMSLPGEKAASRSPQQFLKSANLGLLQTNSRKIKQQQSRKMGSRSRLTLFSKERKAGMVVAPPTVLVLYPGPESPRTSHTNCACSSLAANC